MLEMLVSKTEQAEAGEHWAMCIDMLEEAVGEIILDVVLNEVCKANEEGWTTAKPRSKGKAQKERTGLAKEMPQHRKAVTMRTVLLVEQGPEGYDSGLEMEDADALCSLSPDVQPGHDTMGRVRRKSERRQL